MIADPSPLDFGSVPVGDTKVLDLNILHQDQSLPMVSALQVSSLTVVGADASQFSLVSNPSPFSLPPGNSQDVEVQFAPDSQGNKQAAVRIESNDSDEPVKNVNLLGFSTGEAEQIPTLSDYGLILQVLILMLLSFYLLNRRQVSDS